MTSLEVAARRKLGRWKLLRLVLTGAVITSMFVVGPVLVPGSVLPAHADPQPVSGAFSLGGGVGGSVDERTGQFSASVPLLNVASRGDSGINMSLSYDQSRAFAGVDRVGIGSGWSLGTTFINTVNTVTAYPASGGSYAYDPTGRFPSRLVNYPMEDLSIDDTDGTLPARGPLPAVDYSYRLSYDDGRVDYFDDNGNLAARADRFDNRTYVTYQPLGANQFRPTSITDAYGLTTTLTWDGTAQLTVSSPKRSDGVVSSTVVAFDANRRVSTVTDPVGRVTTFGYGPVPQATSQYLTSIVGPAGARTKVAYQAVSLTSPTLKLFIAHQLDVTDADGNALSPTRYFDINPAGNNNHNYAGYPTYVSNTSDELFARADPGYRYSTSVYTDTSATVSTYDSLHRLRTRKVETDGIIVQQHDMDYPGFVTTANYARPTTTTLTMWASSGPDGFTAADTPRVTSTTTAYDDHGRVTSSTDNQTGTTTTTTYDDSFGLISKQEITQVKTVGGQPQPAIVLRSINNTLTADNRAVVTTTVAEASPSGTNLSARTTDTYGYDDYGQMASKKTAFADGAAPPGDGGGPASVTTSYASTEDPAAATRSIAVTVGAGTPDAQTTTTVTDLVSGSPVQTIDGLGRVTSRAYDAANRIIKSQLPTGQVASTSYSTPDEDTPPATTITSSDGHAQQTTYDGIGRAVSVTDNVTTGAGGVLAFTTSPTTRSLSSLCYGTLDSDGCELQEGVVTATDKAGRTTVTSHDALNRPVSKVGPTGISYATTYNDVANMITTSTTPDNASTPSQSTATRYDSLNREISSRTSYPGPGPRPTAVLDPVRATNYDGLGRPTSITDTDVTMVPDYAGPAGITQSTTVGPAATARTQSDPITSTVASTLTGQASLNTLTQDDQNRSGIRLAYNAAGLVSTSTDPNGKTTHYGYATDGQLTSTTSPSGVVTTRVFDPTTGQLKTETAVAPDGTKTTTGYTYVPSGQTGAGLVASVTNESGTVTYGYDADRNRVSVTYPDGSSAKAVYGTNGLQQSTTDGTDAVTTYAYNTDSSLHSATQQRGTATVASVVYTYDGLDRIETITRGNGLKTTHTYTRAGLLESQITGDAAGNQVEAHNYIYDNHRNLLLKTDTTAKPSRCTVLCAAGAATFGQWTTSYKYDAYNRLTSSAVYSGASATGTPTTKLDYGLDVSGNVVSTKRTTSLTSSGRPTTTTSMTTNTLDDAGQLTAQTTGSATNPTTTPQTHDDDGRVLSSVTGMVTTYRPDGRPATATTGGVKTTFAYWADGSRRRATTVDPQNGTSCIDFHYGVDGTLLNDTTTTGCGTSSAVASSASYLITAGREARTLVPAPTPATAGPAGKASNKTAGVLATNAAPVTTGSGVGYLLRDRHGSVTALVDSSGAVTNTYAYGDYGTPALLDGRPGAVVGATAGTAPGQTNGLRFTGASQRAMWTDTGLGTLMTPARVYDPTQGRFLTRDQADVHNRYAGFDTNPITKVDPSGLSPQADVAEDVLYIVAFTIAAVITGIATFGAGAALMGAAAAEVTTGALVASFAAQGVATLANAGVAVSNALLLTNDSFRLASGKQFLTDDQRSDVSNVATVLGAVAGVAGMAAAGAEAVTTAATHADISIDDFAMITEDPDPATNLPNYPNMMQRAGLRGPEFVDWEVVPRNVADVEPPPENRVQVNNADQNVIVRPPEVQPDAVVAPARARALSLTERVAPDMSSLDDNDTVEIVGDDAAEKAEQQLVKVRNRGKSLAAVSPSLAEILSSIRPAAEPEQPNAPVEHPLQALRHDHPPQPALNGGNRHE